MRAVKYDKLGTINVVNVPEPQVQGPNDIKIMTSYASICGFDMMTIKGRAVQLSNNFIGHEASGIVVEVGKEAKSEFQVGDPVTIDFFSYCGLCSHCRRGNFTYCDSFTGIANGMAEYIVKDKKQIHKLPKKVSLFEGCLTEPVTLGLHTLSKANLKAGQKVIILGGGAMGLIMLQLALLHQISFITIAEPCENKRNIAKQLGAHAVIDPNEVNIVPRAMELTDGEGFDTVIETSGDYQSAMNAFKILARGGSLIYFALYGMDTVFQINPFNLYWKDASIHGVLFTANLFPSALAIMPRLNLSAVATGIYPFEKAAEAFAAKATGEHAKVVLKL